MIIEKFIPESGVGIMDYGAKKNELLKRTVDLRLPQYPLDDLIEALGGTDKVGEWRSSPTAAHEDGST